MFFNVAESITEEERSARYASTSHSEVTWLFEIMLHDETFVSGTGNQCCILRMNVISDFRPYLILSLYSDVAACYSFI